MLKILKIIILIIGCFLIYEKFVDNDKDVKKTAESIYETSKDTIKAMKIGF